MPSRTASEVKFDLVFEIGDHKTGFILRSAAAKNGVKESGNSNVAFVSGCHVNLAKGLMWHP